MSYYNPFEDSSTYYNPYKQQQAAPQSLTSALTDVAKNMAVYGGLFVLGSAAAKAASSRIGRFIKKGSFGKASSIAKKLDNPTIGSILKNTSLGREYTAYKESTGLFKAYQARQAYLSKVAKEQPYRLGVARITSAFKNPTTFAATIGGIWKQNVLTGLGVSFAIDKMSGNYQAVVPEKKEWYDVPGHIGNLTKWFANESIYASAFGLLGPTAKGAASIGLVGIKKTFDGPMGKYIAKSLSQVSPGLQHINGQTRFFKDKILENARSEHDKTFLAKAIRWGQNFSTSINMNFQNLNAATRAASFGLVDAFKQQGNFGKKIGTALAPISKAIQQIREINARADKIRSERLVDTRIDLSGIRALEAAHAIAADAGISNVITKDSLDEQIMSIRESMKAKQTFLEQMLPGAKRVRNKDVVSKEWVREQVQSLRKRYDNKSAGRFMREILNMNVGENVYKIDNKIVNLNGFSPMNLLRKFISPVLDKEIRLPLTGFKFSLGEITMVDSLLTPKPKLDFFVTNDLKNKYSEFIGGITDPPMFSTNKELREEGIYSIADAMRKQESNVALFTRGGNWSFFGNKEPKTIVTGKELNYSPKSGRFRYSETNEIIIQQLLSEGYSPSEISNKLEGTGKPKTRFGRFVNKMGFGMPSKITDGIRFINNIIEGKNKGYNTAIKNIFENTDINFNIKPSLMVLDDINAHTAQILAQIIKNPKAVEIITSNKKYGNLSDLSNILNSEVHLIEKLSDPDFLKDMWKYDKNLRKDIETVKSYPSIARKHEQVKSLGGLSSMTSIDKLRVAYVDYVLNNQFLDYVGNGNGYHHPLLDAIPKLKEGNYITDKQAKALELHAKLSSLQDLSRRNITEGIANIDPNGRSLWTEMMKNEKQYGLNLHNDLLNFISENKLRRTNLNRYEQRLIQPGNNLERFINNTPYYSSGRGIAGIGQYLGASVDRLTELMGEWTPFKRDPVKHLGIFGGAKYLGGTVLKLAAVTGAYRVADSMVAANPIFEGSGLDDGITGFTADQLAKARLFSSKVGDTLGITGAMKYLNGLMPGSTSTFPGLIAGAAMANYMKASPLGMIKAMAAGAIINRIADPYLPDFSKSYEQLRKEYSGEEQVPFMKSPTWLLGSTPWEGTGVAGYQPNWYVRAKSRWESSDTLYGSEFRRLIHKPLFPLGINIGDFIDPYYLERRHYFDRPYPRCLFGSAKVVTVNGIKKIKDIDIGDYVYDINGSVTKVINVLKRKVNDNDTIFSMRVIGQEEDLILTSDHKIPIIRDEKCIFKSQHNKSCTGNDEGICRYCTKKRKDFDISWVEAKDINIGDFLVKKPINPEYLGSTIDISLYVQRPFDIKENKIFIKDKLGRYTGDSFNRYWDIDNDLAYYFGLYLSEGWLGKQRGKYISVNTVHNKKEFDHINRIINNISKKYNLKFSYKDFGTHVNFYIFDYIFSDIIYGLFNCGSATKSVKFFTKELDRKILAGLFYGNGHYDKTHVVLTSINMNLINFATIVLENDFISTCLKKHCDNGHQSYRLSFSYSYLDDYRLLFDINHKNENILTSNKKLHLIYFRNGYLLKRIIKKEEIEYNDFLYDLTVESPTHSFSLYEFIVHNSGRLFSEVPIIGEMLAPIGRILKPEKTMHQEFLQGEWAGTTDGTNPSLASVPPPTYQQNMIMMNKGNGARSMGNVSFNGGNYTIGTVTPWSKVIQGRLAGNVEDALGLTGFMTKTSLETIFGKPTVMPTLETAGRMASMSRSFYDLNLGGMGVLTEPIRRLITKPEANELRSNPIPNMFPNWLPSQFLSGDAYTKIMKGELRLPGCITPNTFVLTDLGLKYAKDINVNDNVFTLDGYHKVEYVIPKYKNEEIFEIDAYSGLPVHVTGNHHILAIKTSQCKYHKTKDSSVSRRPCKPFHNKSFCKKCCLYNDYQYDWIPADELKKGDYVVLPKVKKTISSINQIKVIDIVKKFQIIEEKPNVFRYTRILNGKKIINNKPIDFPEYITFDEEFMYFAGYYLAEGSIGFSRGKVSSIILCVSLEEKYILDMFKEWLKRKYNIESNYKIGTGNYYIFSIYSVMFSLIISELFGYNEDKKINHKFTNIKYLLAGLFDGDGHVVNENIILTHSKKYRYSYQLPNILLQENIPYSIREKKFDIFTTKIPIIKINNELKYKKINDFCLHLKTSTFIELEDRFLIKIRNINKIQYKGKVYDYQVEKEHNYTTSFLMHNSAYLKTHPDTKMSMPARSSMWGAPLEDIVKYFTGSLPPLLKEEYDILEEGTLFHSKIQDSLAAENLLIQAEAKVYDVRNDISGHVDAIIRDGKGGKGRRALEIKSISDKGFQKLDAPKYNHVGQLNFYLHQLRFNNGTILYINRDNPSQVKTFELQYDKNRWERDVEKLKRGRQIARDMLKENVGDTMGYSYSWLDRLKILADVAPASNEYHEAKEIVMQQIKAGQFTQNEIDKFHTVLKHRQTRLRKYELYPIRFKGKIMSPDTESNIQSINEDIKSGESYSLQERVIGAAWETFTNSNNVLVNKFWARKDPLEHYKELRLYGKEYRPWDEPYSSFIEPFTRTALSKTNPIGGSISWGAGGYTIGGEFGALIGSVLGATYSTVNGLFRGLSNSVYVPDSVKEQRNLNTYFDKLKYERNNMMASLSQGITRDEFISARSATLESFNRESDPSIGNLFRATSNDEKPYIEAWINTTDPDERNNILNIVPQDLATALKRVWSRNDGKSFTKKRIQSISEDMGRQFYNFDQSMMDPRIELDDIKLKTIEDKGFEAHDFGLGWNEQLLRIKESQYEIPSANISEAVTFTPNLSSSQIRQQLYSLFNQLGIRGTANVYINNMDGPNVVNLTIRRDRSLAVINALRNRKQYGLE